MLQCNKHINNVFSRNAQSSSGSIPLMKTVQTKTSINIKVFVKESIHMKYINFFVFVFTIVMQVSASFTVTTAGHFEKEHC